MKIFKSGNYANVTVYVKHEISFRDGVMESNHTPDLHYILEDLPEIIRNTKESDCNNETMNFNAHFVALNALPVIPGNRWQITEKIYNHFEEMLPPVYCSGGFKMSEFNHNNVRSKYYYENGKYWHEWVEG